MKFKLWHLPQYSAKDCPLKPLKFNFVCIRMTKKRRKHLNKTDIAKKKAVFGVKVYSLMHIYLFVIVL